MFGDPLDETMILLKDIVQIFDLQNFNQLIRTSDFQDIIYSLSACQIGSTFINDDLMWNTAACDGFFKETPCSANISALRQHEIKGLTVTINGSV
ncbi:Hypothetical protein BAAA_4000090 [Brucella abortus str. 2308 A]|nr:Hypothetical protein BAAA_4000090 [Brucella abortus str. 2308 A]EXU81954.1 hypothetical protein AX23_02185 [Brucella melitensis 548]